MIVTTFHDVVKLGNLPLLLVLRDLSDLLSLKPLHYRRDQAHLQRLTPLILGQNLGHTTDDFYTNYEVSSVSSKKHPQRSAAGDLGLHLSQCTAEEHSRPEPSPFRSGRRETWCWSPRVQRLCPCRCFSHRLRLFARSRVTCSLGALF